MPLPRPAKATATARARGTDPVRTAFDLLPDVLPRLPGIPVPTLERELLGAAQSLCERARCWVVWTDAVTLEDGVRDYEVDVPDFGRVEQVTGATKNGRPVDVMPWLWLDRDPSDLRGSEVVASGHLSFSVAQPVAGDQIRLKVALVPGDDAPGIADAVFDTYRQILADGVVARCAMMPRQAWSDPGLAAAHGAAFGDGISRVALRQFQGRTNTMPRAVPRWC